MEKLKVFSSDGETLLERDLAEVVKPLMLLAGEKPQLVETVPQGAEVLGALVRDEDGWTLASAKDDMPVSSGPKSGPDFHLTAGIACGLGPWMFRIERESADTGTVLLWRVGSSAIAADPLIQGCNQVAAATGGTYAVNPAVVGTTLCSIFPTADGVDVTESSGDSQRLSIPFATRFSVGPFQGMALRAADATAAVKSGNPFGWPARRTRQGLMAMLLLVGLVGLGALALVKEKQAVDAAIAAKHGPEEVRRSLSAGKVRNTDEDALVYQNSFYRSLPLILKAERSPITRDLIQRGRQIAGHVGGARPKEEEKTIQDIIRFLKAVDDIQMAAQKGDWTALKNSLGSVDRAMFTRSDADTFYADAQKIADFVTVELPKFFVSFASGSEGFPEAKKRIHACLDDLQGNLFMSGEIVRRERDLARMRWQALGVYVPARDRFLASPEDEGSELRDAWADLVDAFESEDEAEFAPMLKRERELLVEAILKRAETASSVALIRLCSLGEAVGVDNSRIAVWRGRANAARKELFKRYREMYSDYRMRAAVSPDAPDTLAVLDKMIALGLEDNHFHQWALREKVRVQSKKKECAK